MSGEGGSGTEVPVSTVPSSSSGYTILVPANLRFRGNGQGTLHLDLKIDQKTLAAAESLSRSRIAHDAAQTTATTNATPAPLLLPRLSVGSSTSAGPHSPDFPAAHDPDTPLTLSENLLKKTGGRNPRQMLSDNLKKAMAASKSAEGSRSSFSLPASPAVTVALAHSLSSGINTPFASDSAMAQSVVAATREAGKVSRPSSGPPPAADWEPGAPTPAMSTPTPPPPSLSHHRPPVSSTGPCFGSRDDLSDLDEILKYSSPSTSAAINPFQGGDLGIPPPDPEPKPLVSPSAPAAAPKSKKKGNKRPAPFCDFGTGTEKPCKQRSIVSFRFCIRHILQDPNAPYRMCEHTRKQGSREVRCTNAVHSDKNSQFCSTHLISMGLIQPKRKNPKPGTAPATPAHLHPQHPHKPPDGPESAVQTQYQSHHQQQQQHPQQQQQQQQQQQHFPPQQGDSGQNGAEAWNGQRAPQGYDPSQQHHNYQQHQGNGNYRPPQPNFAPPTSYQQQQPPYQPPPTLQAQGPPPQRLPFLPQPPPSHLTPHPHSPYPPTPGPHQPQHSMPNSAPPHLTNGYPHPHQPHHYPPQQQHHPSPAQKNVFIYPTQGPYDQHPHPPASVHQPPSSAPPHHQLPPQSPYTPSTPGTPNMPPHQSPHMPQQPIQKQQHPVSQGSDLIKSYPTLSSKLAQPQPTCPDKVQNSRSVSSSLDDSSGSTGPYTPLMHGTNPYLDSTLVSTSTPYAAPPSSPYHQHPPLQPNSTLQRAVSFPSPAARGGTAMSTGSPLTPVFPSPAPSEDGKQPGSQQLPHGLPHGRPILAQPKMSSQPPFPSPVQPPLSRHPSQPPSHHLLLTHPMRLAYPPLPPLQQPSTVLPNGKKVIRLAQKRRRPKMEKRYRAIPMVEDMCNRLEDMDFDRLDLFPLGLEPSSSDTEGEDEACSGLEADAAFIARVAGASSLFPRHLYGTPPPPPIIHPRTTPGKDEEDDDLDSPHRGPNAHMELYLLKKQLRLERSRLSGLRAGWGEGRTIAETAKRFPNTVGKVLLDRRSKRRGKEASRGRDRSLLLRRCYYRLNGKERCSSRSLPFANHCLRHLTSSLDQRLFRYCHEPGCQAPVLDLGMGPAGPAGSHCPRHMDRKGYLAIINGDVEPASLAQFKRKQPNKFLLLRKRKRRANSKKKEEDKGTEVESAPSEDEDDDEGSSHSSALDRSGVDLDDSSLLPSSHDGPAHGPTHRIGDEVSLASVAKDLGFDDDLLTEMLEKIPDEGISSIMSQDFGKNGEMRVEEPGSVVDALVLETGVSGGAPAIPVTEGSHSWADVEQFLLSEGYRGDSFHNPPPPYPQSASPHHHSPSSL